MSLQQVEVLLTGLRTTNGNVLSAGKVFTYAAGTSTPVALFTDSAGLVPAANPIILDAAGRAQVYADGAYKFIVKDSADATVYTWDNLYFSRVTAASSEWTDIYGGTSTGAADAYAITVPLSLSGYTDGQEFRFIANFANSGAPTLNVNSLGDIPIVKGPVPSALSASDIKSGDLVNVIYDSAGGGRFRITSIAAAYSPTPLVVDRANNRVGIQTAAPSKELDVTGNIAVSSATSVDSTLTQFTASASGPVLALQKSRGATVGTHTIAVDADTLGSLVFRGANGTTYSDAASISAVVNGTPGASNDMPGALVFSTSADASATPTERARVDAAGAVILGNGDTSTSPAAVTVRGTDASGTNIAAADLTIRPGRGTGTGAGGALRFATAPAGASSSSLNSAAERMRVSSAGNVGIGATSPSELLHIKGSAPRIRLEDTDGANSNIYSAIDGNSAATGSITISADPGNAGSSSALNLAVDGSTHLTINGSGEVAVGGSSATGIALGVFGRLQSTVTANESAVIGYASSGSYTGSTFSARADRTGSAAFNFLEAQSNYSATPDSEFKLKGDGNGTCDGAWTGGGADYAEYFEWFDGNPSDEDRRGLAVSLVGNKIKVAEDGDVVIGVISSTPSLVGDSAWNKWTGKYLRDEFNAYILEQYEIWEWDDPTTGQRHSYASDEIPVGIVAPINKTVIQSKRRKLNPQFDSTLTYVPRSERPEWDMVGLLGKLRVRKGQEVGSGWIKLRDVSSVVEEWLVR